MNRIRILVLGDSHTHAIKQALSNRNGDVADQFEIEAYRYSKIKNGKEIGDLSPEAVVDLVASLENNDMIVSTIGGNQHQTLSLVQHPVPFDLFIHGDSETVDNAVVSVIPYAQMWDLFERGMRGRDGTRLQHLSTLAQCDVYHLTPPPPKKDSMHILNRFESDFAIAGILERGVSPAPLRLKMWRLQVDVLHRMTAEWGVQLVPPPDNTMSPEGYLETVYYADDATHANTAYGELVLRQIERIALNRVARN
jgi:hypothetical protein